MLKNFWSLGVLFLIIIGLVSATTINDFSSSFTGNVSIDDLLNVSKNISASWFNGFLNASNIVSPFWINKSGDSVDGNFFVNGSVTVNGSLYVQNNSVFSQNISVSWLDGFVNASNIVSPFWINSSNGVAYNVTVIGSLDVNSTINLDGGFSSGGITLVNGNIWGQSLYISGSTNLTVVNVNNVTNNGSLMPFLDNQFDIGSPSLRWRNISVVNGLFSNLYGALAYSYISGVPDFLLTSKFQTDNSSLWSAINSQISLESADNTTQNTQITELRVSNTTIFALHNADNSTKMPKIGGTFTGNITMDTGKCIITSSGGAIC